MPTPAPQVDTNFIAASSDAPPNTLPDEPAWALFLDLDGTLCEFHDDPAAVALAPAQAAMLATLKHRLGGALCVLSGRGADDLDRAIQPLDIERVGDHGHCVDVAPGTAVAVQLETACAAFETLLALDPGLWLERKNASCALHYRRAPHLAARLTEHAREFARASPDLRLLEGNHVLELGPAHSSKGHALRRFMRQPPFARRVPVAVGDDVTDEDAFVAAAALGGFGIAVGSRASRAARFHLADSDAVNAWLARLAEGRRDAQ